MSNSGGDLSLTTLTSTTLLEGLKAPDNQTVWRQYTERYQPMLVRFGRRMGLATQDAEDVAQQTLLAFCESYRLGKYDRQKGRLRDWLFGIARNQLRAWRRKQPVHEVRIADAGSGTDFLQRIDDDNQLDALWEQEWRDAVLRRCLEIVRGEVDAKSFDAFQLFASQGLPAAEVAERLGMTANAVFIAKHRILKRIRELLPLLEETW